MKVAILTPTFCKFSGPDRVAENEAEERTAKGDEVTVFAFKGDIQPKNYKVKYLGMPKNSTLERAYRLFFFLDILKIMKTAKMLQEYDETVSFLYPMTIIAATANKYYHKRYIYYNVGVAYPKLFESLTERIYMKLFNTFTNFTVKNADQAISISNFLREELKRETGLESKVKYVKVNAKEYNKNIGREKAEGVIRRHNLTKPILLYVGRLSPHKGAHLLLEAFEKIAASFPTATLVITGKPTFDKYSKKLNKASEKINKSGKGKVIFTGFVPDEELPHYFAACDLYTTATLWEGFDIPAVHAQMCGKKVVAFEVGSHPEVVKEGILVKEGDINGFAEATIKLLKN